MKNNPYAGYGNITIGNRFIGRLPEIERLSNRLVNGAGSLSVIGEPRIGKSSLVKETLIRSADQLPALRPVVWINLATVPTGAALLQQISSDTIQLLNEESISIPPSVETILATKAHTTYDAFRQCYRIFAKLLKSGVQAVLVIDEFDAIRHFPDAPTIIQALRELIYHQYETGLSAVFISRRSLRSIEMQLADVSTLDGVCEQLYIGPFHEPELQDLVKRCQNLWELTPDEFRALNWNTGGHPFLSEMLLCHSLPVHSIDLGFKTLTADFFDYYEHLQQLLREDGLFEQLIQITVGPRWSLNIASVDRLIRYGVIKEYSTGTQQGLTAWSEHFQRYLEKCSRDIPIWPLWHETEKCLRAFIESTCKETYGDEWLNLLKKRHKTVAETIDKCERLLEQEKAKFPLTGSQYILHYTYPMDLWQIIAAEWQVFGPKLQHDKNYWTQRFSHLAKIRTPAAHIREHVIPEHDIALAQAMCKEIIDLLNSFSTEATIAATP